MVRDLVTVKAVHTCDCSTAIVRRHSPTAAMNSSTTASQPASTNGQGTATIRLSLLSSLQGSVQVARRGHSASQPTLLHYWLFCPAFACALILLGNPSGHSTLMSVLREFPEQLSSLPSCPSEITEISMPPYQYARETRDTMLPLPDKTRDPCSRPSSARSLRSPER